jgi:hypothetical protein
MQFSTVIAALALAATSVLSQDLSGLPTCAATCFTNNFANSACASTDVACLCGDSTFFGDVEICVLTDCDTADATSKSLFSALIWKDWRAEGRGLTRCSYSHLGTSRVRCCRCSTLEEAIGFWTETLDAIPVLPDMEAGSEMGRHGGGVVVEGGGAVGRRTYSNSS